MIINKTLEWLTVDVSNNQLRRVEIFLKLVAAANHKKMTVVQQKAANHFDKFWRAFEKWEVRTYEGMTAKQFKRLRMKMFQTQPEAAAAMGVSLSSLQKWEGGSRTVPAYIVKLLNCMKQIQSQK